MLTRTPSNDTAVAPPRRPPPKNRRPAQQQTGTGPKGERGRAEYTPEERQQQGQRLVGLIAAAHAQGDREAAQRHWDELRSLVLARLPQEIRAMEAAMGLRKVDQ